jgi:predicted RNA-binding protein associated with RNAse of E/G family
VYRSWHTTIETMDADSIVTVSPAGSEMQDQKRGVIRIGHTMRSYYWFDKFYNLIELFDEQGNLAQIYINIASPPYPEDGSLCFKDYELDVFRYPSSPAELLDEDEFAEAIITYQYTKEFQEQMYSAANEALELANRWNAQPAPEFGGEHAQ